MVGLQRHPAGYCRERRRTTVSEIRTKQTVALGDTSYTRSFPQILNTKAAKAPVRTRLGMHAPGPPSNLDYVLRRRPNRSHTRFLTIGYSRLTSGVRRKPSRRAGEGTRTLNLPITLRGNYR